MSEPTPEHFPVAVNVKNTAEGRTRWSTETQNKLRDEIATQTKADLEALKKTNTAGERLPVRVVRAGDTLGAVALGLRDGGVPLDSFNWQMPVEYRPADGKKAESIPLSDARWQKLFLPGCKIFVQDGGLVVEAGSGAAPMAKEAERKQDDAAAETNLSEQETQTVNALSAKITELYDTTQQYLAIKNSGKADAETLFQTLIPLAKATNELRSEIQAQPEKVQQVLLDERGITGPSGNDVALRQVLEEMVNTQAKEAKEVLKYRKVAT